MPVGNVTQRLTGPAGWNDDPPYDLTRPAGDYATFSRSSGWLHFVPPLVGEYTVALIDDATSNVVFAETAVLDSLVMLDPLNAEVELSQTELSASWEDTAPTGRYRVTLYKRAGLQFLTSWTVSDTELTVSDMFLDADEYTVIIENLPHTTTGRTAPLARHDLVRWVAWPLYVP